MLVGCPGFTCFAAPGGIWVEAPWGLQADREHWLKTESSCLQHCSGLQRFQVKESFLWPMSAAALYVHATIGSSACQILEVITSKTWQFVYLADVLTWNKEDFDLHHWNKVLKMGYSYVVCMCLSFKCSSKPALLSVSIQKKKKNILERLQTKTSQKTCIWKFETH